MRRKLTLALAAGGVIGLAGFAAIGLAGGGPDRPPATVFANGYASPDVDVQRVAEPSAGARAQVSARARAKKVRLAFFETDAFPIADGEAVGDTLTCPGNRRVLGGYFGSNGTDVALTFSAPEPNNRKSWFVGVTNLPDSLGLAVPATEAFEGIVCAKGVK